MASRLHEELIQELQEQKKSMKEQIDLIDPLASSLHQPAYKRYLQSGFSIFLEIILVLIALGIFIYAIFYTRIPPFYHLKILFNSITDNTPISIEASNRIGWSIQAAFILISILLIIISRMMSRMRLKNNLLHLSSKNMKQLVELHLRRRAAIETLEQRYYAELPTTDESVQLPPDHPHNDIPFDKI